MGDGILGTDLFGDPVLPRREGRGRPEVVWDRATSNRVLLCFARRLSLKETATVVGVSVPTLRKVYFSECAKRRDADLRMEMRQLERLNDQAEQGNVSAERELWTRLDKLRLRDEHRAAAPAPQARPAKLGKKAAAEQAARDQRGLYEPPPAPRLN